MSTLRLMAIDAICQRGSVRDSDVATLRRAFALEPQIAAGDIDALFRAHALARVQDPSWAEFFIETLTDYVVRELEPAGYVTGAHAGWLIARVSTAGRVRTKTEHDLLLNVIDKARWVPESLMVFALGQIRDAVASGEGPLRAGAGFSAGTITLSEVEQIRALLFAYGNEGPASITQAEAELLLDIDRALVAGDSMDAAMAALSPLDAWPLETWRDLLEKAIANAVLAASGYAGPTREEALNEAVPLPGMLERGTTAIGLLRDVRARTTGAGTSGVSYHPLASEARALLRLELQRIEIITGEPVLPADPARLASALLPDADSVGARVLGLLRAADFTLHATFGGCARHGAADAA